MRTAVFLVACFLAGCGSDHGGYVPVYHRGSNTPLTVDIDARADTAEIVPPFDGGQGVGVFVDYQAGGSWSVFAACDTSTSGYSCSWDLVASIDPTRQLAVADQSSLSAGDQLFEVDNGAVRMALDTSREVDRVVLSAPPGEPLTLDVVLDGVHDIVAYADGYDPPPSNYVSWVTGGAAIVGAPSNPVTFLPAAP